LNTTARKTLLAFRTFSAIVSFALIALLQPIPCAAEQKNDSSQSTGQVLPTGRLFKPLTADPRWPHFSFAYHHYLDDDRLESVGATSFGESLGFYRNRAPFDGQWQVGIQAGVFAIFDLDADSNDLINADYWIGIPLSYRAGPVSALLRLYHQSSHLGDEFLLRSRTDRVNLSYEGVDLKLSLAPVSWARIYAGGGYLLRTDPDDLEPWSGQAGFELTSRRAYAGGLLRPVGALDAQFWEETDWNTDLSIRGGLQVESEVTADHMVQLLAEYYNGHSPNGQFYDRKVEYVGLGVHFYF